MIHAIMVSVNYADYLAITLPEIQRHVSEVTVVTSWEDLETLEIATRCGASVCRTDKFRESFRKGAAIDEAIKLLNRKDCWILHLDADIAVLDSISVDLLDRSTLYGARRYSVIGRRNWDLIKAGAANWVGMKPCPQDDPFLQARYSVRRRVRYRRLQPPGFFQLWHSSACSSYSQQSVDASLDDLLHTQRFKNTALLPHFGVYHLESKDHDLRANWQGRTTGRF